MNPTLKHIIADIIAIAGGITAFAAAPGVHEVSPVIGYVAGIASIVAMVLKPSIIRQVSPPAK